MDDVFPAWVGSVWCANDDDREPHFSKEGPGGRAEAFLLAIGNVAQDLGSKSPDQGSNDGAARKPLGISDPVAMRHGNGSRIKAYDPARRQIVLGNLQWNEGRATALPRKIQRGAAGLHPQAGIPVYDATTRLEQVPVRRS